MRKIKRTIFCWQLLLLSQLAAANNLNISNPVLTGQNQNANTVAIKINVSWENSYRVNIPPFSYDAAWIFAKYRVAIASGGDGLWRHIILSAAGHLTPAGTSLTSLPEGAFIYRSDAGSGTFIANDLQLQWNYGNHLENGSTDFIDDDDAIEIQLFGIEMVFVPGGQSFYVGGGTGANAFQSTSINSSTASAIGSGYPSGIANNNAAFPNGYNSFYCMKYEISQRQYAEFLNTLSYTQQVTRTAVLPNSVSGTGALSKTNANRNGIDIKTPGVANTKPAEYACNLDGDKIYDEVNDGQWIACNFLSWADLTAYFDWSGLRPMTELEFEKACRGSGTPGANEYAWGTESLLQILSLKNPGTADETYGNGGANVSSNHYVVAGVAGPVRVGAFAAGSKSRAQSGATIFGIMEMSGNLWERVVSAGANPVFTGTHGNGQLAINGNADAALWPGVDGKLSGFRGGSWFFYNTGLRISDRFSAQYEFSGRDVDNGGRGVRSAP